MASKRLSSLINRNPQPFSDVLGSLKFSSTAEDDIGGLDEALEKFAKQKADSEKNRRGPVLGIADDVQGNAQFELAEDAENFQPIPGSQSAFDVPEFSASFPPVTNRQRHLHRHNRKNNLSECALELRNAARMSALASRDTGSNNAAFSNHRYSSRSSSVPVRGPSVRQYVGMREFFKRLRFNSLRRLGNLRHRSRSLPTLFIPEDNKSDISIMWLEQYSIMAQPQQELDLDSASSCLNSSEEKVLSDSLHTPVIISKTPQNCMSSEAIDIDPPTPLSCLQGTQPADFDRGAVYPPAIPSPNLTNQVEPLPDSELNPCDFVHPNLPRIKKRKRNSNIFARLWLLLSVLVMLIALCWTLSVSPFAWGIIVGGFCTYCSLRVYNLIAEFLFYRPGPSGTCCFTHHSAYCCSLHNSQFSSWRPPYGPLIPPPGSLAFSGEVGCAGLLLPTVRDLPPPPVPQLADEDVKSGPAGGPLADSLGYRLDKNQRPVYKGWMNEIVYYSPETYHINSTHSVFVTLEGTRLRIQRPKKNVSRRAMLNVPVPSTNSVLFIHQRIFDMSELKVSLLPIGLVEKRMWSKKYPICLTTIPPEQSKSPTPNSSPKSTRKTSIGSALRQIHRSQSTGSALLTTAALRDSLSSTPGGSPPHAISHGGGRLIRMANNATTRLVSTVEPQENGGSSPDVASPDGSSVAPFDFCLVRHSDVNDCIFLFARTSREKEAWFRRLHGASIGHPLLTTTQQAFHCLLKPQGTHAVNSLTVNQQTEDRKGSPERSNEECAETSSVVPNSTNKKPSSSSLTDEELQLTYLRYMAKFMPTNWLLRAAQAMQLNLNYVSCDSQVLWLNALIGRVFWDFLRHEYWAKRVQEKIQGKLKKLHLPYFVNELTVTSIDLGTELPVIRRAGKPFMDNHGIWIEAEIIYNGGFTMVLETNINLMKLRASKPSGQADPSRMSEGGSLKSSIIGGLTGLGKGSGGLSQVPRKASRMAAFLSDEEDSADSSTDSDSESTVGASLANSSSSVYNTSGPTLNRVDSYPLSSNAVAGGGVVADTLISPGLEESGDAAGVLRPKKRLYRIVNRIARSTYFQKAVDSKFVQRGMEYVSNKPINLQLEVSLLYGTLVVNVPPPPSDRLWYGFRGNPNLRFKLKPKVGEKMVNIPRLVEILEKKVMLEFQRVVVLPNMDDIVIPLLIPENSLVPGTVVDVQNPYDIKPTTP